MQSIAAQAKLPSVDLLMHSTILGLLCGNEFGIVDGFISTDGYGLWVGTGLLPTDFIKIIGK